MKCRRHFFIPFLPHIYGYNRKHTTPRREQNLWRKIFQKHSSTISWKGWGDDGYRAALEREKEAAERLKETLTEEQMAMVEQYHIAISATMGICELLAYKQGMKDMASILK